jgi:3'-5' exonuclease
VDSLRSKVLFLAGQSKEPANREPPASAEFFPCANETELLNEFWEVAVRYESIITFNGRGFDIPFIYLRSALLDVRISRKDWLGYRFQVEPHCDLLEQLTFYGVSGRDGAARRFNLDFYCKAFGIPSPKSHGITGMDVGRLMAEGRAWEVAEYCWGDVQATVKLYNIWKERLAGLT